MKIRALIMAGGIGTRFWPLSRKKKPKQFLPIISSKTMVEETVERLAPLIPLDNIYTISNLEQAQTIQKLLPLLPPENLIVEPQGKNTAPSLLLATAKICLEDPKSVLAVLPADHLIRDVSLFLKKLEAAAALASEGDYLLTFGIPPTHPATGYGYIHFSGMKPLRVDREKFYTVLEFKEKPCFQLAERFLAEGNHYWNSGMFIWRAEVFVRKLEEYAPTLFPFWQRIIEALDNRNAKGLQAVFEEIPSISIDYALMEKTKEVLVCEGDFGWSDVGAWSSLAEIWERDARGNALRGEALALDSENCLVFNPDKLTALMGVKDLIVVDTGDALLICHRDQDQKVREIIEILRKKGSEEYL